MRAWLPFSSASFKAYLMNEIELNPNELVKSAQLAALAVDKERYYKYFLVYDKVFYLSNELKFRLQEANEDLYEELLQNPTFAEQSDKLIMVSSHIGGQLEENLFGWYD